MNTPMLRRTAIAAVTVLALGGTAACGGGSTGAHDAPNTPTSPASSASSSSSNSTGTLTKDNFAAVMLAAVKDKKTAHVSINAGSLVQGQGDVSYGDGSSVPSMRMTMKVQGKNAEIRLVGGSMYMSIPGLTPAGKFLEVDKSNPTMGGMFQQLQQFNPTGSLDLLQKGVKSFKDVGKTTVGGDAVEHYRITVNPKALVKSMGSSVPSGAAVPKSASYDLYVGAGNLMRRAVVAIEGQKVTVDVTKWGEPVSIQAPPKADVEKMPSGMTSPSPAG